MSKTPGIDKLIDDIAKAVPAMAISVRNVLHEESTRWLRDLKNHSPVDTGEYKAGWRIARGSRSAGTLASVSIVNPTMGYGFFMEHGGEPGGEPWPHISRGVSRSGKLRFSGGRIWAGGLNPGHDKTVGGAIDKVFTDTQLNRLADKMAEAAVRALF